MLPTLGLILPWREAALERYKMRHCLLRRSSRAVLKERGWEFFKRGWWLWLLALAAVHFADCIAAVRYFPGLLPLAKTATQIGGFVTFLMLLVAPFIYGVFKAMEWRWWLSGIRFGDVRFESSLRARGAGRPLLESDRLVPAAFVGVLGLSVRLRGFDCPRQPHADCKTHHSRAICRAAFRCWCWR